jgi:hypothetical protein
VLLGSDRSHAALAAPDLDEKFLGHVPPAKSKSLGWLYGSLVVSTVFAALLVIATIWFAAWRQAVRMPRSPLLMASASLRSSTGPSAVVW